MKQYISYDAKTFENNTDRIAFATRSEAEAVLNILDEDVELFGRTSVERLRNACVLTSTEEDKAMGWDEEAFAKVSINRVRYAYEIIFPEPQRIKPLPELKEIFRPKTEVQ